MPACADGVGRGGAAGGASTRADGRLAGGGGTRGGVGTGAAAGAARGAAGASGTTIFGGSARLGRRDTAHPATASPRALPTIAAQSGQRVVRVVCAIDSAAVGTAETRDAVAVDAAAAASDGDTGVICLGVMTGSAKAVDAKPAGSLDGVTGDNPRAIASISGIA